MILISKSEEAPASLAEEKEKENGSYSKADVLEALKRDAHNKCYLCEDWSPTTIHVEHFDEHRGNVDKKFDWKNLFFSCGHCNSTKAAVFPRTVASSDILNCTKEECKVDLWLIHRLKVDSDTLKPSVEIIQNPEASVEPFETQVRNTINLLSRIFNGSGVENIAPSLNSGAENLRLKVAKELKGFKLTLFEYLKASTTEDKEDKKRKILSYLNVEDPFLSFKHWILRDNHVSADFDID